MSYPLPDLKNAEVADPIDFIPDGISLAYTHDYDPGQRGGWDEEPIPPRYFVVDVFLLIGDYKVELNGAVRDYLSECISNTLNKDF